jgi:hypothetical protein
MASNMKMVVSTLALALALVSTATAEDVVVTPGGPNGWVTLGGACGGTGAGAGSQGFAKGPELPPGPGAGSYEIRIGSDGQSFELLATRLFAGVKLVEITTLSYATYVQRGETGQAPHLELSVDTSGDGAEDDRLVLDPAAATGRVQPGVWQTWNALRGGWQSNLVPDGFLLADYALQHPAAAVIDVRLSAGCGPSWANFVGNVDQLTLNGVTINFETVPLAVQNALKAAKKAAKAKRAKRRP